MGIEAETVEAFFRAVSETYAPGAERVARHRCEAFGRCVYDERCPLIDDCMPTEYSE